MTIQQLLEYCTKAGIPLDTPIALRAKDDYLLTAESISVDNHPYFGNCRHGDKYLEKVAPKNEDGEVDYDSLPAFLILGTGSY